MSTSLLYHAFGVRGYDHINTKFAGGAVIFKVSLKVFELQCSSCKSRKVIRRGIVKRKFRSLPIGNRPVLLSVAVQRVECLICGLVRQVKTGFADYRRSYTKTFERYALELSRHMTIQDTARHLGVSWDVIKDIQKRYLQKRFSRPKLKDLKIIAIDEISIGKRHRYLTVVLDLKTGAVRPLNFRVIGQNSLFRKKCYKNCHCFSASQLICSLFFGSIPALFANNLASMRSQYASFCYLGIRLSSF